MQYLIVLIELAMSLPDFEISRVVMHLSLDSAGSVAQALWARMMATQPRMAM
jgi:hypothetical protein